MTTTDTTFSSIDALRRAVRGTVHVAGEPGFDQAHAIFYRYLHADPLLVVTAVTAEDVSRAVTFAVEQGLEIAVRSGGHSGAGHGSVDGGLVIDLSGLDAIDVDVDARTVTAGTGATAGAVTAATGEHGLAVGFGDTGSVGVGGITTGGGVGFLSRAHGLTIDNVLSAQVVTADGTVHEVDTKHEPDLFWAVRGGGGNVGVVTRFTFRAHEVPQIVGGLLVLPATPEALAGLVRAVSEAPEALGAIVNVMPSPPVPFVPAELHGHLVVFSLLAFNGPPEQAEPVLARLRAVAEPIADLIQPMPYAGLFQEPDGDYRPVATSTTGFAQGFGVEDAAHAIDVLTERLADPDVQMTVLQLRPLGGAIARVAPDQTAYAHRSWPLMFNVAAIVGSIDDLAGQRGWIDDLGADVAKGTPGAYVGFSIDDHEDAVHRIYPGATYDRLAAIKRQRDPDNVFHRNHNVPPAAG